MQQYSATLTIRTLDGKVFTRSYDNINYSDTLYEVLKDLLRGSKESGAFVDGNVIIPLSSIASADYRHRDDDVNEDYIYMSWSDE